MGEGTDLVGQESEQKGHDLFRPIITIDRILHEPARLVIVILLANMDEIDFRFLKEYFGLSKRNLSSHGRDDIKFGDSLI